MPVVNELDVLIASPSDVKCEREVAARVVEELNSLLDCHGIRLRSRLWERDATPRIGERPQAILNTQLGDSCDIFVGIMWSRIGSSTGNAESGTVEEFRRANIRLGKDHTAVQVLFFFSEREISPKAIDVAQFSAVQKFRHEIEQLGLISTFSSLEQFEFKLRVAIYKTAIDLVKGRSETPQTIFDPSISREHDARVSEEIDESGRDLDIASAAIDRIGQTLIQFLVSLRIRTDELRELNQSDNLSVEQRNENLDLTASDLLSLSADFVREFPIHQSAFSSYFRNMSDVIVRSQYLPLRETRREDVTRLRGTLVFALEQFEYVVGETTELVRVLSNSPEANARLDNARRFTCRTLSQFIQGMRENISLLETILDQLKPM